LAVADQAQKLLPQVGAVRCGSRRGLRGRFGDGVYLLRGSASVCTIGRLVSSPA